MKLTIENNLLYIDNKRFCFAKVNDDGSEDVRLSQRKVSTQYSHAHGKTLPLVADLGWVGYSDDACIVLGDVLGSNGPLPCALTVQRLVANIEACEDVGRAVLMEIK